MSSAIVTVKWDHHIQPDLLGYLLTLDKNHTLNNIAQEKLLIDEVKVLRHTQHKIDHFGDVPQANLWAWYGKTKPNTTKAHIHQSKQMYFNTKKTKARFSHLLRHPAWKQTEPILILALHEFLTYL